MTLACCRQIYSSFPVIRPGGLRAARISFTSTFGVARHVVPSASSVIRVTNTGQPTAVRSSGPVATSSLINQPPINQSISQHSISNQQSVIHQSSITVGLGRLPARGSTRRRAARALPPLPRHQSCNAARRAGPYLRGLSRQHSVLLVESPRILRFQSFCACVEVKGNGFRLPPPTQELKHPGGDVFGGAASSQLAAPDSAAWEPLLSHRTGTASFEEPLWAQHSEPVAEPESSNLSQAAAASSKEVAPAQHSEPSDVNWVRDPLRRTGLRPDCQSTWIRAVSLVLTECSLRRARRRVSLTQRCNVP